MRKLVVSTLLLLAIPGVPAFPADIGTGFGESRWVLTSARQAATGGIALEDPWRRGLIVEAGTVQAGPGVRWLGLGAQGDVIPRLRLGLDGFLFQGPSFRRTIELDDGSYGGEGGMAGTQEWGGQLTGQLDVWKAGEWNISGLGRIDSLYQRLPDTSHFGASLDAGVQAQKVMGSRSVLTSWALGDRWAGVPAVSWRGM